MRLIDTHCHLNDTKAFPDPSEAIAEAHAAGIEKLVVVGVDPKMNARAIEISEQFDSIYAAVGWHPTSTKDYTRESLDQLIEQLDQPKTVALGEIGLDYHWDFSTREEQYRALLDQLDLAESRNCPVIFHCREAESDLLDVLEKRPKTVPYLFHCFAGTVEDARRGLDVGGLFGVDGPVTYPKSDGLRDVMRFLGPERIVIETDAPWMAPVPYRGKRNRPSYVTYVNEALAAALGISPEECAAATTRNAEKFFGF